MEEKEGKVSVLLDCHGWMDDNGGSGGAMLMLVIHDVRSVF